MNMFNKQINIYLMFVTFLFQIKASEALKFQLLFAQNLRSNMDGLKKEKKSKKKAKKATQ